MKKQIKAHVKKYKTVYYCVATGVVVGGIVWIVCGGNPKIVQGVKQVNLFSPRSTQNVVQIAFTERSTPSKPVHLVGTNSYFDSLSHAARETGHSLSMISRQINGHIPNVKGDVFEILDKVEYSQN
jgi:hypothetical protein